MINTGVPYYAKILGKIAPWNMKGLQKEQSADARPVFVHIGRDVLHTQLLRCSITIMRPTLLRTCKKHNNNRKRQVY